MEENGQQKIFEKSFNLATSADAWPGFCGCHTKNAKTRKQHGTWSFFNFPTIRRQPKIRLVSCPACCRCGDWRWKIHLAASLGRSNGQPVYALLGIPRWDGPRCPPVARNDWLKHPLKEDLVTGESFVVLSTMKIYVHNFTNTNLCVLSPSPPPQQHQQQATARQFDEPQQQPKTRKQNKHMWKGLMGGIRSPFLAHSPLAGGWVEGCVYTRLPHQSVGH